jgi:hypothetical protein
MKRREFTTFLSDAAVARPLPCAQQPTMPVKGVLHPSSLDTLERDGAQNALQPP